MSNNNANTQRLVLYDGECVLCNASVQCLLKIDKNEVLTFATLQYAKAHALVDKIQSQPDSIIYLKQAKLYNRSNALIELLIDVGGVYKTAILLKLIPTFLRDIAYHLIAKYRYRIWGKTDQCMFLTPQLKHRFLGI